MHRLRPQGEHSSWKPLISVRSFALLTLGKASVHEETACDIIKYHPDEDISSPGYTLWSHTPFPHGAVCHPFCRWLHSGNMYGQNSYSNLKKRMHTYNRHHRQNLWPVYADEYMYAFVFAGGAMISLVINIWIWTHPSNCRMHFSIIRRKHCTPDPERHRKRNQLLHALNFCVPCVDANADFVLMSICWYNDFLLIWYWGDINLMSKDQNGNDDLYKYFDADVLLINQKMNIHVIII